MQTFLPSPDFQQSASYLDRSRLGKQRVECYQIALALSRPTYPWQSHPAVNMWRGHLPSLILYAHCICDEWTRRGYEDDIKRRLNIVPGTQIVYPKWLGDDTVHSSHRSNLLLKGFFDAAVANLEASYGLRYIYWPNKESYGLPKEKNTLGVEHKETIIQLHNKQCPMKRVVNHYESFGWKEQHEPYKEYVWPTPK